MNTLKKNLIVLSLLTALLSSGIAMAQQSTNTTDWQQKMQEHQQKMQARQQKLQERLFRQDSKKFRSVSK